MGLLKFTPNGWTNFKQVLDSVASSSKTSIQMTQLLQKVIEAGGVTVMTVPNRLPWGEIDTPIDHAYYNSVRF